MDIRFLTSFDKNMAYCLLKGSKSGTFAGQPWLGLPCLPVGRGHRSPVLSEVEVSNLSIKENKAKA